MTTTREAQLEAALSESTYNHPMSLVTWQSWIDDLPLPDDFDEAKNALQEYLQQLAFPTALATPATEPQGYVEGLEAAAKLAWDQRGYSVAEICDNIRALAARPAPQPTADTPAPMYVGIDLAAKGGDETVVVIHNPTAAMLDAIRSADQPAVDTRVVPLSRLQAWLDCLVSLEIKAEIRAIIGNATPAPSDKIAEAARLVLAKIEAEYTGADTDNINGTWALRRVRTIRRTGGDAMTADQDLSAWLPCGCCGAMQPLSAYANDPVVMVITLADHERAVQAAVAKAVKAEREDIAAMLDRRAAQFPDDSEGDNHNTNAAYMVRLRSEPAIRARKGDAL